MLFRCLKTRSHTIWEQSRSLHGAHGARPSPASPRSLYSVQQNVLAFHPKIMCVLGFVPFRTPCAAGVVVVSAAEHA